MPFQKGKSGNASGRPRGKTAAVTLRTAIEQAAPDIIQVLIQQANTGDVQAAKVLLDRICPTLKPVSPSIALVVDTSDLLKAGAAVITSTANGALPVETGSTLMGMLAQQAKMVETQEILTRLEALEAKNKKNTQQPN